MKIAESYSVIVIPKDRARVRRWVVSRERIMGTLTMVLGFVTFTSAVCFGLFHYRQGYLATEDFRTRGGQYEKERVRILTRLNQIEEVVTQNGQLATKLETIVGINNGKSIPVGLNDGSKLKLASLDPAMLQKSPALFDETTLKTFGLKAIDLLEEAKDVGGRLKEVYRFNTDTAYFWSAIPTIWPVKGWVTSDFGFRRSPLTGSRQLHEGVDIASPYGTTVVAAGEGVVTFAGRLGGLGNKVIIDHGYGLATVYGHNSQLLVQEGEHVIRGTVIARVGSSGRSTGPHLHYEVLINGVPVDPARYILEQL